MLDPLFQLLTKLSLLTADRCRGARLRDTYPAATRYESMSVPT